ncbi:MAG: PA14 domain-containing protein [bacterium]|nr:PA14 domain-containing protein [bacterium]
MKINKKQIGIYIISTIVLVLILTVFFVKNGSLGLTSELLKVPIVMQGNKNIAQFSQILEPRVLSDKKSLVVQYDLRGICLLGGQASALTLKAEDERSYSVSLADYGENCAFGKQNISIPLDDFLIDQPLENMRSLTEQFWYPTAFNIDIKNIIANKQLADILYYTNKNIYAVTRLSTKRNLFEISRSAPAPLSVSGLSPPPSSSGIFDQISSGYRAEYWNTSGGSSNPKIPASTPNLTRNDIAINFDWNLDSPDKAINIDYFIARFQKTTNFDSGTYSFTATADDGVRVYIDNELIINKWKGQPPTTYKSNKVMTSGAHSIRLEYYENIGAAVIKFDIQKIGPSIIATPPTAGGPTTTVLLAPTLTSPSSGGLQPSSSTTPLATVIPLPTVGPKAIAPTASYSGEYWNTPNEFLTYNPKIPTSAPNLTRNDLVIKFPWNFNSPDPSINIDHFVARWQKNVLFDAGTYRFSAVVDDGIRVYIDNNLIMDEWRDQGGVKFSADRVVSAGVHALKIEYFEDGGGAGIDFDYQKISSSPPTTVVPTPIITPTPTIIPTPILSPISSPVYIPTIIAVSVSTITPISTPNPTPTPVIPTPTTAPIIVPIPTQSTAWFIRSVSSMKETKDKICNPDSLAFINSWINKAVEIGANYVAVETPYNNPACGSSVAYTKAWVDAVHARGLSVWHRHMPLAFEGIYDVPKNNSINYLPLIADYIKANPTFFKAGDIFSPIPEPQNGGISGITYCPQNICIFGNASIFNKWLRDAMTTSESAFASIGLGGQMKIGYYGFDGFVAWGDNNPDWNGILEDSTVQQMGNITIDHYPEIVGDTMENDLNELQAKYPTTPIVIGEWGTITGGDIAAQVAKSMQAAIRPNVIGFNYWHMGMGGNETLINNDFTNRANFEAVKSFFLR